MSMFTDYSQDTIKIEGQIATTDMQSLTAKATETVAGIAFGLGVVYGTGDDQCKVPTSGTDKPIGFTVFEHKREVNGTVKYNQYDTALVMRRGELWVKAEVDVVKGDPVFIRHTASGLNTTLGKARNTNDSSTALAVPNATFITSGVAGTFVKIRLV